MKTLEAIDHWLGFGRAGLSGCVGGVAKLLTPSSTSELGARLTTIYVAAPHLPRDETRDLPRQGTQFHGSCKSLLPRGNSAVWTPTSVRLRCPVTDAAPDHGVAVVFEKAEVGTIEHASDSAITPHEQPSPESTHSTIQLNSPDYPCYAGPRNLRAA